MKGRASGAIAAIGVTAALASSACRAHDPPEPISSTSEGAPRAPAEPRFTFVPAPDGPAAAVVRDALAHAGESRLLVYVGASWCEPCQRFHEAAASGALDRDFADARRITLLEFDADRDGPRLAEAGYRSKYIPLFVVPSPTGEASDRRIEGAVKGDGAVAFIVPRLRGLLAR